MLERRHEEDGVDIGRELAVGVGHLELRFEVAHSAQSADDEAGPDLRAVVHGQAVEAVHLDLAPAQRLFLAERLRDGRDTVLESQHGRLARVDEHAHDELVEDRRRPPDDVEVAERDRIERARVERGVHAPSSVRV